MTCNISIKCQSKVIFRSIRMFVCSHSAAGWASCTNCALSCCVTPSVPLTGCLYRCCVLLVLGEGNVSAADQRTASTFFFSLTASHLIFQMLLIGAAATAVFFSRRGCQQGSALLSGSSFGLGSLRMNKEKCVCVANKWGNESNEDVPDRKTDFICH